jgi:hypothetical protein
MGKCEPAVSGAVFRMKHRLDGHRTLTLLGVAPPDSVGQVSARALNQVEAERVRDRIVDLLNEKGSEKAVGEHTGISQQTVGKIKNRTATPGYHTATKIADADRVPVEVLLGGAPPDLYRAMASRRWAAHVIAAVSKMALTIPRSRSYTPEDWHDLLRRTDESLAEIIRGGPRSGR